MHNAWIITWNLYILSFCALCALRDPFFKITDHSSKDFFVAMIKGIVAKNHQLFLIVELNKNITVLAPGDRYNQMLLLSIEKKQHKSCSRACYYEIIVSDECNNKKFYTFPTQDNYET